ncbi:MAG: hypothetical protein AABN95_21900 [Acidobacteriota bacterium]
MKTLRLNASSASQNATTPTARRVQPACSQTLKKHLRRTCFLIGFSLIVIPALLITSPRVQSAIRSGIAQTIKIVEPFCTDFNDNSLHGWGNGGSQVKVEIKNPGASGQPSDLYFHATDKSGSSWISASPEYRGDWTKLAEKGCGALCFDVRLFIDGLDGGHIGDDHLCTTTSGACPPNTFRPIRPQLILISDPDGPGGNLPLRAVYRANTFITEDGGSNPGWHHICAPVTLLANSNLPSDANGTWLMADNAPNSSWNSLLANVTDVQFGIDFTANPAEEVGYDNFCFKDNACPQTSSCATIEGREAVCKMDGSGGYTYTFSVTNNSGKDVTEILLTPPTGSGLVLSDQTFPLTTPLPNGQSTTITVDIGNVKPRIPPCFFVTLMTKDGPCCTVKVCPVLPDCCATATGKFACDPKGSYTGTVTIVNTSPNTIKNIYLYPPAGVTMSQTYFAVTLAPGQSFTTPLLTIKGAKPGRLCFRVSMHTEDMKDCCSVNVCIVLPECGYPVGDGSGIPIQRPRN